MTTIWSLERDGRGYRRLLTSFLAKYLLMGLFLATDMALNASAEFVDLATSKSINTTVSVVLAQAFVQIIAAINLFVLLGMTFPFRNGLLGLLGMEFRSVLYMHGVYFALTTALGISRISILSSGGPPIQLWDRPDYYLLSALQKLAMVLYCHLTLNALTKLGSARFYTKDAWVALHNQLL
ncbi:hypothetical protein SPRG_05105 [Saprolegnia parasitica CBS 223.65]|uniref:Uncharacterized protein n=1 Tax=Saprolegnia parasitica (strain CBS 223.65) TaxID=695850 RepID=A0A067CI23_SAPPC|nr:hypothetical protein SPRG_05105 [Saprolegnia parasitica CBS 223.65]KDO30394.1 hypothetical protein SPRG_05105 [Saprolegnia parasitica CBS 223.65]|eukprot:XP_012199004.1 hypothetical protein SPRG_05105 [Saprolegnia parasitica CBS 223.65]